MGFSTAGATGYVFHRGKVVDVRDDMRLSFDATGVSRITTHFADKRVVLPAIWPCQCAVAAAAEGSESSLCAVCVDRFEARLQGVVSTPMQLATSTAPARKKSTKRKSQQAGGLCCGASARQ